MTVKVMKISNSKHMSGFTLIEVLVAVIVLAIGLIGMAGLQATALQSNTSANQRTKANMLASSLIDRIRVTSGATFSDDAIALTSFINNQFVGQTLSSATYAALDAGIANDCNVANIASGCNPGPMAAYELFKFSQDELQLGNNTLNPPLPNVAVHICRDNTPDDGVPGAFACGGNFSAEPLVVKVVWNDDRSEPTAWQVFATPFRVVR